MNIKFRMPKFQNMITKGGVLKEMLMTVIATSISIVLTFGTAMWLEKRQKQANGRQMAMMVIHDMDANIDMFVSAAKDEVERNDIIDYVMGHIDQLESIPVDTLIKVWSTITSRSTYIIDDSKERIFNSSQETWKTIDSPMFIDLVQEFYTKRRTYQEVFKNDRAFQSPITEEEEYALALESPEFYTPYNNSALKKLLGDPRFKYYQQMSYARKKYLEDAAGDWQRISDQCKFIMGITDEELKEYIDKQKQTGSPVNESELVGTWGCTSLVGDNEESLTFYRDHTFTHTVSQGISSSIFSGLLFYSDQYHGKWQIVGDSLIREYDKGLTSTIDTSRMSYTPAMSDTVARYVANLKEDLRQRDEDFKNQSLGRKSNAASIDKSGSKIEMPYVKVNEYGEEKMGYNYMSRKK